jgi:PhoD related phosphatase
MQDARSIFSYTINDKTFNIKVPGSKENRVFDFNSCNGFQTPADADKSKDPQHVWRIVQEMVGLGLAPDIIIYGGDQGYFDPVWKTPPLAAWSALQRENREEALQQPFTPEMEKAADDYYRNAYINHFSYEKDFGKTLAEVPSWMSIDDHDIYDGSGSYSDAFENCPVIQGIKSIAKKYYYLFQLQTFPTASERQSEFIGNESTKVGIVGRTAVLAPDTRNHRSIHQIIEPSDWEAIINFLLENQQNYDHALFVFPVPFIYPDFSELQKLLEKIDSETAELIIKKIHAEKVNGEFGHFDIIDDFQDHWNATSHKPEFQKILTDLFKIRALGKSVLILGGDVHHGCETEVRSKEFIDNVNDPYLIKNAISSPIVNNISPIAHFIPILAIKDKDLTKEAIARLVKIQPVLPQTTTGTTIIADQNFIRVSEVAQQGLEMVWHESHTKDGIDDYSTMNKYRSFTPIYVPIQKPVIVGNPTLEQVKDVLLNQELPAIASSSKPQTRKRVTNIAHKASTATSTPLSTKSSKRDRIKAKCVIL